MSTMQASGVCSAQDDSSDKQNSIGHLPGVLACLETLWKQCSVSEAAAFGQAVSAAFSKGISAGDSSCCMTDSVSKLPWF